jgi:hypothetical protein
LIELTKMLPVPARRASLLLGLGLTVLLALGAGRAHASTYVFTPVADSRVNAGAPSTNYGKSKTMVFDASPDSRGYLRFDVEGLQGAVTSATLRLHALTDAPAGAVDLRPVADTQWQELGINYNNRPPAGSVVASSGSMSAGQRFGIDASSVVPGEGLVSLALSTTSSKPRKSGTREVSAQTPQLVVETDAPNDPVIAAAGDIACDPSASNFNGGLGTVSACHQMATSDLMVGRGLSAVLPVGDLQYEDGRASAFAASYDPSWGRLAAISHPVPGGEEYTQPGAGPYFDYFNGTGNMGGPAGPRGKGYYSYDVGTWHVIALNSRCDDIGGCGEGSPQDDWLEADLAAHPSSCTLAYFHDPRFSSSGRDPERTNGAEFWNDLYVAGADVILSASDHAYERFARQAPDRSADPDTGIREFIVGTGGVGHPGPKTATRANSGIRNATTFGVLELTLRAGSYDWRFVPESRSSFTDSGSDTCTGPTVDTTPPVTPAAPAATLIASDQVRLSWPPTTDNDGVARYRIIRNGVEIGTTDGNAVVTSYTDATVQPSHSYQYRLVAQDAVGNVSQQSGALAVTTPAN